MAIRLEHQPIGIAGLAAFAAGSGRRKERDRKYFTDLLQNQQDRTDKYNLLANQQQFIAERDRERNVWDVAADQRRNEARIGEINLGAKHFAERDELNFKRDEARDNREYGRKVLFNLPPIPDHAPPEVRAILGKYRDAMSKMVTGPFDLTNPDDKFSFDEANKAYNTGVANIPKPDLAQKVNDDTIYRDKSGTAYKEPGADRIPYSASTGKPVFDPVKPGDAADTVAVPGRGDVPVKTYQDDRKEIADSIKEWKLGLEKALQNAITPAERKAAQKEYEERNGSLPVLPPSVMDLRHPKQPAPAAPAATPPAAQAPAAQPAATQTQPQAPAAQATTAAADPLAFLSGMKPIRLPPEFPPGVTGVVPLPDGTVEYNGQIYRRRQ